MDGFIENLNWIDMTLREFQELVVVGFLEAQQKLKFPVYKKFVKSKKV